MGKEFKLGLSFDDVLLVPHYSNIRSRKDISLCTQFSRRITLNIPIVSANMDTVTESRMAIAMARAGGIGIIHRFLSIEEQAQEVKKVKRAEHMMIEDPLTILGETTLGEALQYMQAQGVSSLLVTSVRGELEGILSSRDVRFKTDFSTKVCDIMTPRTKLIVGKKGISRTQALRLLDEHKIEKLPIVSGKNHLVGLITAADFRKKEEHKTAAKDEDGQLLVGAAVGVKDGVERAERLVKAGCDALVIDIAHGHHARAVALLRELKRRFKKTDVVAGNVVTARATTDLIRAGADAVKVGIGPGAACSTRVVAGAGVPQITAVAECAQAAKKRVPIIADGGVKNSGDVAKAIAVGASTVMIGNLFAGSLESPGEYYIEDGGAYKMYRGLASRDASRDRAEREGVYDASASREREARAPEGVGFRVSYKGEVRRILENLTDGLQSGMSYSGARSIPELWKKAEFVRITEAGMKESAPRTSQQ